MKYLQPDDNKTLQTAPAQEQAARTQTSTEARGDVQCAAIFNARSTNFASASRNSGGQVVAIENSHDIIVANGPVTVPRPAAWPEGYKPSRIITSPPCDAKPLSCKCHCVEWTIKVEPDDDILIDLKGYRWDVLTQGFPQAHLEMAYHIQSGYNTWYQSTDAGTVDLVRVRVRQDFRQGCRYLKFTARKKS